MSEDIKVCTKEDLQVLASTLATRLTYANKLGMQYGDKRSLYDALGYSKSLTFGDYKSQYDRQDIAKAVIDRPIEECWRDGFKLGEDFSDGFTEFEKAFTDLYNEFGLKDIFIRADKLTCLGRYCVL